MTKIEMQNRIKILRNELENRYKYGVIKLADDGKPISTKLLQDELYALIYKLSKFDY